MGVESEMVGKIVEVQSEPAVPTANGIPLLSMGAKFAGKFKVDERIGWDDVVGATYLALPLDSPKELILRIDSADKDVPSSLYAETALLKLAEAKNRHVFFTQIHSFDLNNKFPWLALYFRGGPTVAQCLSFSQGKFSHGTAARFAYDMFSIVEFIHRNGFLATRLDFDNFSLDPCSRHVFLSDTSYVKVNPVKRDLRTKSKVSWRGWTVFAPLSLHGHVDLSQWDELESLFYLLYCMVMGNLPWSEKSRVEMETHKLLFKQENNFKDLPEQYFTLYSAVLKTTTEKGEDYGPIKDIIKEIYEGIGGVTDWEQNFDFEVDFPDIPEEELPRFVLEKKPVEEKTDAVEEETVSVNA